MELANLFDSNFVYFAAYTVFMASVGQYVIWKKISNFCTNFANAFRKAQKQVIKQKQEETRRAAIETVEVKAVELVSRPDLKFKVNKKEAEKQLKYIREQRAIDAGMHNLTSKFHKAKA